MRAFLALLLTLAANLTISSADAAETDPVWYRVEVIVLTHEGGRSDAFPVSALDDFSELIDPRDRAAVAARTIDDSEDGETEDPESRTDDPRIALETVAALTALEGTERGASGEAPRANGLDWPQPYVNLPRMSQDMQSTWDRLERSAVFKPRAWRAWHQLLGREQRSQAVRIHDEQVLRGDWLHTVSAVPVDPPVGESVEFGPLVRGNEWLPEPEFRLDGSFRIYQTQFMHAASNLTWREPVEPDLRPLVLDHVEQGLFRQHRLEQSRAIRPGRLEYFDSSWLGILLKVTPLEISGEPAENDDGG